MKRDRRPSVRNRFTKTYTTLITQWGTHGPTPLAGYLWMAAALAVLVSLDVDHLGLFLVPPFAATLTIILLLPDVGVAQPYAVIVGSTVGAGVGTIVNFFGQGPLYAGIAGFLALAVLIRIHAFHPPGVALALYPVLLHPGVWFPLQVVLPFGLLAVGSAALCSRFLPGWPAYPRRLRGQPPQTPAEAE